MLRRVFVLLLVVCLAPAVFAQAQEKKAPADPISGVWTDGKTENTHGLEIAFDGKRTLTGKLIPGGVAFKTGTFDPKTGVIKIDVEMTGRNNTKQTIVIDGKLAEGKLSGSFDANGEKGTFVFTRLRSPR